MRWIKKALSGVELTVPELLAVLAENHVKINLQKGNRSLFLEFDTDEVSYKAGKITIDCGE